MKKYKRKELKFTAYPFAHHNKERVKATTAFCDYVVEEIVFKSQYRLYKFVGENRAKDCDFMGVFDSIEDAAKFAKSTHYSMLMSEFEEVK